MALDDGDVGVHVSGAHVWVRDDRVDSGWIAGEVLELLDEGKKLRVKLEDESGQRDGEVVEKIAEECALHNPGRNVEVRCVGKVEDRTLRTCASKEDADEGRCRT